MMKDTVVILSIAFAFAAALMLSFPWIAIGMLKYLNWAGTCI